jgi:hypothetical protein
LALAEFLGDRRTGKLFTPLRAPCQIRELRREERPAA